MQHKGLLALSVFAIFFLLSSCTSVSTSETDNNLIGYSAWNMKTAEEYDQLFSLFNSYGGSVCMGISGPYSDQERAIEVATERCVQYIAFSRALAMQVNFGTVLDSDLTNPVIEYSAMGGTSDEVYSEVANQFEIVDIKWLGGKIGAVVFARTPDMKSIKVIESFDTDSVPTLENHYVAIASSSERYSEFADAIEAATFRTAAALIDIHEGTVNVSNSIVDTTSTWFRGDSYSISGNKLEGFAVLAYTYDMEENKVYALAVCNK